jgi:hypothetical protein
VQREALAGARWIKVYNQMDEECLAAIVDAAARYGMKVCGHANQVPPHRASALGIGTVEHANSLAFSALPDDVEAPAITFGLAEGSWCWRHADLARLDDLMEAFRDNDTGWVPTFVVLEAILENEQHDRMAMPTEVIDGFRIAMREAVPLAVRQHRAGGLVGLGTDFPVNGVQPGVSAHRELELLVEGGATPLEALQIATTSSAEILGFEGVLGQVRAGFVANFILLEENPLEDISRTRGIVRVVHDGRLHDPHADQRAQAEVEAGPVPQPAHASPLRLHRASETRAGQFTEPAVGQLDRPIYLEHDPVLSLRHIAHAERTTGSNDRPELRLNLTDDGRTALSNVTRGHEGLVMAIIWKGEVISAPRVMSHIASPYVVITGGADKLPEEMIDAILREINERSGADDA